MAFRRSSRRRKSYGRSRRSSRRRSSRRLPRYGSSRGGIRL